MTWGHVTTPAFSVRAPAEKLDSVLQGQFSRWRWLGRMELLRTSQIQARVWGAGAIESRLVAMVAEMTARCEKSAGGAGGQQPEAV